MADFNFILEHRPGKDNVLADALSRREQYELDIGDKEHMKKYLLPSHLFASIQNKDTVVKEQIQMKKEIAEYKYVSKNAQCVPHISAHPILQKYHFCKQKVWVHHKETLTDV